MTSFSRVRMVSKALLIGLVSTLLFSFDAISQVVPQNIMIFEESEGSYPPCEPSIWIDPSDPSKVVAGAVLDQVAVSSDSGKTWERSNLTSRFGVYGDPCIISDEKGRFYYFHLSDPEGKGWASNALLDRIVVQRMKRFGKRWDKGWSIGLEAPKDQDKEWAVWDPINQRLIVTWTQFDAYGSKAENCESNILYSTSKNGKRWTDPVDISTIPGNCIDNSGTNEGAVPAVLINGDACVAWSLDGNIHFASIADRDPKNPIVTETIAVKGEANWTFDIPGLGRANGMPITVVDHSDGPHRGSIYINWADQRNGKDDTDVWVVRSEDKGQTWSAPIRVNDDSQGSHQFFTWMAIDQSTGYLYTVFYDRRHYNNEQTDVVLATSKDGGLTWENRVISESPFTPEEGIFFGDYNNISAANGVIRPIWTRYENGKLSVWTALIQE